MGKECEYHEQAISRSYLEELRRNKSKQDQSRQKTRPKRGISGAGRAEEELGERPSVTRTGEKAAAEAFRLETRSDDRDAPSLHDTRDRSTRPTGKRPPGGLVELAPTGIEGAAAASAPDIDRWTYEDHLNMLDTISETRTDPSTGEQRVGHTKGNAVFDRTTKMLEDFDELEDLDENVSPLQKYAGLKLDWGEEAGPSKVFPHAALTVANEDNGPWLPSHVRRRIGLPEYPVPSVEVEPVAGGSSSMRVPSQTQNSNPMRLAAAGHNNLRWMDNLFKHNSDWNDGGRLLRVDETASFQYAET